MSRRKQARPIRVLDSEEGLNNFSLMDLNSGSGCSKAHSVNGSLSEIDDEDRNNSKIFENHASAECGAIAIDVVYERLKSVGSFDVLPTLLEAAGKNKLACAQEERLNETASIRNEYDDYDNEQVEMAEEEEEEEEEMAEEAEELSRPPLRQVRYEEVDKLKREDCGVDDGDSGCSDDNDTKPKQDDENDNNNNNNNPATFNDCEGDGHVTSFPCTLPSSHVTLEALQNTKVAVAQFAATALANNVDNAAALQELAMVQSTLYQLHRQQLMQINLIQQLQHQLQITRSSTRSSSPVQQCDTESAASSTKHNCSTYNNSNSNDNNNSNVPIPLIVTRPVSTLPSILTLPKPSRTSTPVMRESNSTSSPTSETLLSSSQLMTNTNSPPVAIGTQSSSLPPCSISSSFASSIINNLDPPPSPSEPNSLEMLKKRTQEVLDNASQGLLASNLADELAFRKSGSNGKGSSTSPYDSKSGGGRSEPFFKHRCRYCGKVFGSDSALQIHIRSHTGERPFKCNVCGSRFTTKGNLKVHFQRHSTKFPHVRMNPNPIPEHLDKLHPPLLAQIDANDSESLPSRAGVPHPSVPPSSAAVHFPVNASFHNSLSHLYRPNHSAAHLPLQVQHRILSAESLLRPIVPPFTFFGNHLQEQEQEQPENLCKSVPSSSNHSLSPATPSESGENQFNKKSTEEDEETRAELEISELEEYRCGANNDEEAPEHHRTKQNESTQHPDAESDRCPSSFGESSVDSKYSKDEEPTADVVADSSVRGNAVAVVIGGQPEESLQEEPENLSNKSRSDVNSLSLKYSVNSLLVVPSLPRVPNSPTCSASSDDAAISLDGYSSSCTPLPYYANDSANLSKDPFLFTNLRPRLESTDNSWENLIEINKTSETSKLEKLVDNIGHKLTDPNECVVCHRVLSCKSALQMHYRTHTGERPFRCKICGRSFTTKGNLKTHMGVHRIKPPVRLHHQCPVCHKRFTNSLILQQHIRLHTGEPTVQTSDQIQASEIKEMYFPLRSSSSYAAAAAAAFSKTAPAAPHALVAMSSGQYDLESDCDTANEEEVHECNKKPSAAGVESLRTAATIAMSSSSSSSTIPNFSTSLSALEKHVKSATTMSSHMAMVTMTQSFVNLCTKFSSCSSQDTDLNNDHSDAGYRCNVTMVSPEYENSCEPPLSPPRSSSSTLFIAVAAPTADNDDEDDADKKEDEPSGRADPSAVTFDTTTMTTTPLDLTPVKSSSRESPLILGTSVARNAAITGGSSSNNCSSNEDNGAIASSSPFLYTCNSTPYNSTSPLISSALTSSFNPLGLAVASSVRGNTTCSICYKTFACNSALEIHYRSHTKERPFKCSVCDRGFSTKGNMKQHMLTHKIRDMPSHLFDKSPGSVSVPSSLVDETSNTSTESKDTLPTSAASFRCVPMDNLAAASLQYNLPPPPPPSPSRLLLSLTSLATTPTSEAMAVPAQKRSPVNDTNLPVPKRQPSSPKHLCHVCNKNFSSSSALQIHMRTHTGDKPFRCTVCLKAFTTKGNLKVHMGTHMWTNGASRRGRRMSLELPSLPINSSDSQPDLLHRRPDLFYSYLPTPFLNGVHQKLNEISSIQSVPGSLTNGFFPFGGYGNLADLKRSTSPMSPPLSSIGKRVNSDTHSSSSPWDLHFESKSVEERIEQRIPSPPHPTQHQPHGEGLAA